MDPPVPPESALVGLRPAILTILRRSDLSEVSAKKVRASLDADGLLAKVGARNDIKDHKKAVDEQIRVCFDHVSSGAPLPAPASAAASASVAFGGIALPGMGGIPGGGFSAAPAASNGHSASSSSSASASKKRKKVKGEDDISSEEEDGAPAPKAKKPAASKAKKASSSSSSSSASKKKSKASADDGEKKAPNPNNPFNRPVVLSSEMAAMCGDTEMPRYMITKKLWEYIKGKDLQNPENKREILCDERLQHLFGKPKVDSFEMAKLISKHVSKKEV